MTHLKMSLTLSTGEIIVAAGETITKKHATAIKAAGIEEVKVQPFITDEIVYMSADEEDALHHCPG